MRNPRPRPLGALFLLTALAGCAGQVPLPTTRPIVLTTGERLRAEPERMAEVEAWLRPQLEDIDLNPDFLIRVLVEEVSGYPWQTLDLVGDTANIGLAEGASDAETPFMIYAHLRLMQERGNLAEWAPEAEGLEGYELERAILERVADVWLLGRTVFDTQPFGPMDELLWAREAGYLEDFLVATQGDRFPEEEASFREQNPDRASAFRDWFQRTFERPGPGFFLTEEELANGGSDDPA